MPIFSEHNKERVDYFIYDGAPANPQELEGETEEDSGFQKLVGSGNILSFFQDIQRKTKLETNMDTSGMLSRNSFEIRAMRVVIAPLPFEELTSPPSSPPSSGNGGNLNGNGGLNPRAVEEFIYNSVLTLRVGEKLYLEVPTHVVPSGTGVWAFGGNGESSVSFGDPSPLSTHRFCDGIVVPPQQSFRAEIAFTRGIRNLPHLSTAMIRVWVLLHGYLTRDVQ